MVMLSGDVVEATPASHETLNAASRSTLLAGRLQSLASGCRATCETTHSLADVREQNWGGWRWGGGAYLGPKSERSRGEKHLKQIYFGKQSIKGPLIIQLDRGSIH